MYVSGTESFFLFMLPLAFLLWGGFVWANPSFDADKGDKFALFFGMPLLIMGLFAMWLTLR